MAKNLKHKESNIAAFPVKHSDDASETFCGHHMKLPSFEINEEDGVPTFDRFLHAAMGKTMGLSPASLALAYADWAIHLMMAPGRQRDLAQNARVKAMLLASYLRCQIGCGGDEQVCCAEPMPQDRRFRDEGWDKPPYNLYKQAFLLSEQWWQEAMRVRGMTQHHEAVLPFMARQFTDMVSPLNFPWTNPRVAQATLDQGGMNFMQGARNFADDLTKMANQQPPHGSEDYKIGENIAATKGKVVYQNRLIELIQYAPATKDVHAEPVLIVPAWIMKYYILDLSPENSLVKYLVEQGHTVFMISWKNPGAEDRDLGFDDYLQLGAMEALEAINAIIPEQKIHAAGYCLGGTLLAIAAAAMARDGEDLLQSLTLFTAQIDFEEAGELLMFTDESQLSWLEDVMWEKGYLEGSHMAGTFHMLRSYDLIWSRIVEEYMIGNRRGMNDLMAWNADTTRMPYRMHSEYLRSLFLNNDLAEGRFIVCNKPVALSDIRTPVFAVSTQRDHVAPWRSVYKIHLFADTDVTFVLASGGHNAGIVSEPGHPRRTYQIAESKSTDKYLPPDAWSADTPSYEGSWWIEWKKWLAGHSGEKVKPPSMGASKKGYKPLRDAPGKYVLMK